jgi:hypothetical protein
MVTAQRQRFVSSHSTALALAPDLRRSAPAPLPQTRAMPKSRRREYQAWMSLLIMASGLLLALGVMSLYGRICQTSEINRRCKLNNELKVAKHLAGELTLLRAKAEADTNIAAQAARFSMVRRTDRDAVTIP